MNYRKQLSEAYLDKDKNKLSELKSKILEDTTFLNQWFDTFIDKFSDKMDAESGNRASPVWKKYYERFDEYSDLKVQLNTVEFYFKNV